MIYSMADRSDERSQFEANTARSMARFYWFTCLMTTRQIVVMQKRFKSSGFLTIVRSKSKVIDNMFLFSVVLIIKHYKKTDTTLINRGFLEFL